MNISYETIIELLRREMDRRELQKLDDDFLAKVKDFTDSFISKIQSADEDEKTKLIGEFDNLKSSLKNLYNRRERKIVNMALDKSRTKSNIVDTTALLKEEKELFDDVVNILNNKRDSILNTALANGVVFDEKKDIIKEDSEAEAPKIEEQEAKEEPQSNIIQEPTSTTAELKEPIIEPKPEKTTKLVRFIHAVPRFLGKELEVYGPFDEEDVANLPAEIADVLIKKQRAEEIVEE